MSSPRELFIPAVWCNLTYYISEKFGLLMDVNDPQGSYCIGRNNLEGFGVNVRGKRQSSSTAICWIVLLTTKMSDPSPKHPCYNCSPVLIDKSTRTIYFLFPFVPIFK